jgi:hypothetical protein
MGLQNSSSLQFAREYAIIFVKSGVNAENPPTAAEFTRAAKRNQPGRGGAGQARWGIKETEILRRMSPNNEE